MSQKSGILTFHKVTAEPGFDNWASPTKPTEDYQQWLIDAISKDQGVAQAFGFLANFYAKCGANPSYPTDKPVLSGLYADDLKKALTVSFNHIVKEAKTRRVILAKAESELEKHRDNETSDAEKKTRGAKRNKPVPAAPKRIETVIEKDWKPNQAAKAKNAEFMAGFKNFLKNGDSSEKPPAASPTTHSSGAPKL